MKPTAISIRLAVATLFCVSLVFAQQQPSEPAEGSDIIRQRMEWFYNQRAYPLKHIPAGARLRALKQLDQMLADEATMPDNDLSPDSALDVSSAAVSSKRRALVGAAPGMTP